MMLEKQKIYKKVFDNACRTLVEGDPEERFRKAAVCAASTGEGWTVEIPFFDEIISLIIPGFEFKSSKGSNVTLVTRIILLHYLNTASGAPTGDELIPYEDVPGCRAYLPVFEGRVVKPLLSGFGFNREAFEAAGRAIEGEGKDFGDASFTLWALPKVPLTFILWEGDHEFPPSVKVLFDRTISEYLPLEDITVISKLASTRILKAARMSGSSEF